MTAISTSSMSDISIELKGAYSIGRFSAMACPCEILLESSESRSAQLQTIQKITQIAFQEARRIEQKFSRYRNDNIIYQINHSNGKAVSIDEETSSLLSFANQCYELSEGKFDITSGILRQAWKFDGSDKIPTPEKVAELKSSIGWGKVKFNQTSINLPAGMEVDLGGIGKEYAVDSTVKCLRENTQKSFLVNYGGDIACPYPRKNNTPWSIGVDNPEQTGENPLGKIELLQGGLATSGDARRYLLKDGIRYSHILDPHTGYPVPDAPRSVTVIANTCIEAGMLSTFAMLEGNNAIEFLKEQDVQFWVIP